VLVGFVFEVWVVCCGLCGCVLLMGVDGGVWCDMVGVHVVMVLVCMFVWWGLGVCCECVVCWGGGVYFESWFVGVVFVGMNGFGVLVFVLGGFGGVIWLAWLGVVFV